MNDRALVFVKLYLQINREKFEFCSPALSLVWELSMNKNLTFGYMKHSTLRTLQASHLSCIHGHLMLGLLEDQELHWAMSMFCTETIYNLIKLMSDEIDLNVYPGKGFCLSSTRRMKNQHVCNARRKHHACRFQIIGRSDVLNACYKMLYKEKKVKNLKKFENLVDTLLYLSYENNYDVVDLLKLYCNTCSDQIFFELSELCNK
jgi:hypothetical protein